MARVTLLPGEPVRKRNMSTSSAPPVPTVVSPTPLEMKKGVELKARYVLRARWHGRLCDGVASNRQGAQSRRRDQTAFA